MNRNLKKILLLLILLIVGIVVLFLLRFTESNLLWKSQNTLQFDFIVYPLRSYLLVDENPVGQSPISANCEIGSRILYAQRDQDTEGFILRLPFSCCESADNEIHHTIFSELTYKKIGSSIGSLHWLDTDGLVFYNYFHGELIELDDSYGSIRYYTEQPYQDLVISDDGSLGLGINQGVYAQEITMIDFNEFTETRLDLRAESVAWQRQESVFAAFGHKNTEDFSVSRMLYLIDGNSGEVFDEVNLGNDNCPSINFSNSGGYLYCLDDYDLNVYSVNDDYELIMQESSIASANWTNFNAEEDILIVLTAENEFKMTDSFEDDKWESLGYWSNPVFLAAANNWIYFSQHSDGDSNVSLWRFDINSRFIELVLSSDIVVGNIIELVGYYDHTRIAYINHIHDFYLVDLGY